LNGAAKPQAADWQRLDAAGCSGCSGYLFENPLIISLSFQMAPQGGWQSFDLEGMRQETRRVLNRSIIEVLERRDMMSAATLVNGVLTLQGGATQKNDLSVAFKSRKSQYITDVNGVKQIFDASQVRQLVLEGGDLNDLIIVRTSVRLGASVDGGAGNDTIYGGSGPDTLNGGDGNDQILGRGGNDAINGGNGNNLLRGESGNDTLIGGTGNDALFGGEGRNELSGGGGWNVLEDGYWPDPRTIPGPTVGGANVSSVPLNEPIVGSVGNVESVAGNLATVVFTGAPPPVALVAPAPVAPLVGAPPPVAPVVLAAPVTPVAPVIPVAPVTPVVLPTPPATPAGSIAPTVPAVPAGDVAPSVNIINPVQGQSSAGPGYFEIRANASDTDGSIKEVDFYNGDTLLGSVTAAPYSISWTDVLPGNYTLTAIAIDNRGGGTMSAPVNVTVVSPVVGNTIYVSPSGSSAGDGSESSPLSSIQQAINLAQPGDTVMLEPGTYRQSMIFNNSGTANAPITVEAQQAGTVIIDGADPLSGFTRAAGLNPVYTTGWNHDFFFSGTTRYHGGPTTDGTTTAIGYAEQFIFNGQTLTQVLSQTSLSAGKFYVNYTNRTVSVWLPGGVAPSTGEMLGSTRSTLAAPASATSGQYISLKGLAFQHAANFAQNAAVRTGTGWLMEDCVVQQVNGGGISVQGANAVLLRVTGQNNGQLGIGGKLSEDSLLIDCVSQGNNTKGFSPAWEAGSGKFTDTDGAYIQNFTAQNNNGFGLWFDYENTNYVIDGGTFTGNHYGPASWEGVGIMLEISNGPGRVENAYIHDNSGSGLMVGESQDITIQNNTFVNNDLELRDLTRPPSHIYDVAILDNTFDNTRISTSQGTWTAASAAVKQIAINGNIYNDPAGASLMWWGSVGSLNTLTGIQTELGFELTPTV
jgi:hypothetical protein